MEMREHLKNGNIIECRNGSRYIVMNDGDFAASTTGYIDDLENIKRYKNKEWDIIRIYRPLFGTSLSDFLKEPSTYCDLIWKRAEKKEMTVAEVSKALGYEVKIVKG